MSVIVLSAGGTGGHLFPAQALAGELVRRGRHIVVMTDSRFANYATQFPGARIATVPSSTFSSLLAPFKIGAGIVTAFFKLLQLKPAAVVGFGGYPSVPVMLGAVAAGLPTAVIEQNTVMGRANRLVQNKVRSVAAALGVFSALSFGSLQGSVWSALKRFCSVTVTRTVVTPSDVFVSEITVRVPV